MSEQTETSKLTVDSTDSTISISGIATEDVIIAYEKDIDLTELVMIFSKRIDTGAAISIEMPPDNQDEKVALVLSTIQQIVEAYNASLEQPKEDCETVSETDDDDIPF